jgi:DNA-binding CsgD family transcriptional regulator
MPSKHYNAPQLVRRGLYDDLPSFSELEQRISVSTPWPFGLSLREIQVLNLIADGASNPEIAQRLFISTRTASTHVEHILTKMGCSTRAKLAAVTVAEGLLLLDANNYRNPRKLRLQTSGLSHLSLTNALQTRDVREASPTHLLYGGKR